jgi:oligopeptide/dipeptide ABC transporter ATP-binding protein
VLGHRKDGLDLVSDAHVAYGPLVEAKHLTVHYPITSGLLRRVSGYVHAVDDVDLEIRRGETFGLVGESGCGKSTTGRALIRLRPATSGSVRFAGSDLAALSGRELRRMRRRMQIVFQDPYSSLNPRMTVGSIVGEPLEIHNLERGAARTDRIREVLGLVGIDVNAIDRYPHEFSGGQRQRIGIARALIARPEFLVCDEPISALDVSIQAQVLNLLLDLRERFDLTYLFIAHDLAAVRYLCHRLGVMYLGRIVESGGQAAIYRRPAHPYTIALLSAVPVPHPATERRRSRIILTGDVPSPAEPPAGCRFRSRCWLYERLGRPELCESHDPTLRSFGADQQVACHYAEEVPTRESN